MLRLARPFGAYAAAVATARTAAEIGPIDDGDVGDAPLREVTPAGCSWAKRFSIRWRMVLTMLM